jgi:hypothetical protein
LEVKEMTEEHIFPDGAGGYLTADILCKECNSSLGQKIDGPYLRQPHIQLARNALRISGKRNNIPQPFSEIYEIEAAEPKLRIRMDVDFKPEIIPDISDVSMRPDGSIAISLMVDVGARDAIPGIIQKKLERFFATPEGKALNWTPEQISNAISKTSEQASQTDARESPVGRIHGSFQIDLKNLFLEHLKVAYEISCVHYMYDFIGTPRANEIRQFLYESAQSGHTESWNIESVAKNLRVAPQVTDPAINFLIAQLTNNAPHAYHIALVLGPHIIVSMFGMGVMLTDAVDASRASSGLFVNDIQQKKSTIQASHDK